MADKKLIVDLILKYLDYQDAESPEDKAKLKKELRNALVALLLDL